MAPDADVDVVALRPSLKPEKHMTLAQYYNVYNHERKLHYRDGGLAAIRVTDRIVYVVTLLVALKFRDIVDYTIDLVMRNPQKRFLTDVVVFFLYLVFLLLVILVL